MFHVEQFIALYLFDTQYVIKLLISLYISGFQHVTKLTY